MSSRYSAMDAMTVSCSLRPTRVATCDRNRSQYAWLASQRARTRSSRVASSSSCGSSGFAQRTLGRLEASDDLAVSTERRRTPALPAAAPSPSGKPVALPIAPLPALASPALNDDINDDVGSPTVPAGGAGDAAEDTTLPLAPGARPRDGDAPPRPAGAPAYIAVNSSSIVTLPAAPRSKSRLRA
jgi:hypothetical protein